MPKEIMDLSNENHCMLNTLGEKLIFIIKGLNQRHLISITNFKLTKNRTMIHMATCFNSIEST